MTRKEAKYAAEVMKAYAEGKEIEFKAYGDEQWKTFRYGKDRFLCFNFDRFEYRIKKEPTYRPFKNKEECWEEMQKHSPFGWVKTKHNSCCLITYITKLFNGDDSIKIDSNWYSFNEDFRQFTFIDGTPFGIKEE